SMRSLAATQVVIPLCSKTAGNIASGRVFLQATLGAGRRIPQQGEKVAMIQTVPVVDDRLSEEGSSAPLESYDQQALVRRLNRIEGQVRGIRRMIEEPRSCIEILQQLAAAEAALNRIGLAVFRHHIDHCVQDGIAKGDGETRKQLNELVDIFDRFGK
ncbi:MAG TPA: metal-sensitive transcriptional regulator, partial [Vicinamibacterales bacterium]|nr:metal-sensitive transcriptional regulator [Vicinamibacterales bacterium]